ncbi:cilia- and flagella-associated protein 144 isoform X2 [Ahaetulla prasina]|uniref:cilia- and flagella-associated protein 144 isoform X2 n=1 Tax=Ahaetulla prasina TaxID=499056 RepID=UPI0026486F29|nr:cilia- and flagella-associated protein 144 isoform X2 [Ahaetulla prasina]
MAGVKGVVKEPLDPVSQNKIFTETVQKELRCQRLHTEYALNPLIKAEFLQLIHHAALEPPKKYSEPQSESQEIGWFSTPLISINRNDTRLHFPSRSTEISRYMAALWRLKQMTKSK